MKRLPIILMALLVSAFTLQGCNQANEDLGANQQEGPNYSAAVRGSDEGDTTTDRSMTMSQHMQQCNQMMMNQLGQSDQAYDQRFIDTMVRHHEGAIRMGQDALRDAQRPEIKQMAQKMIQDQQQEIDQLKSWRSQWYGSQQGVSSNQ